MHGHCYFVSCWSDNILVKFWVKSGQILVRFSGKNGQILENFCQISIISTLATVQQIGGVVNMKFLAGGGGVPPTH